jgi:DNA (cytosine-5)-methyltransferase 1
MTKKKSSKNTNVIKFIDLFAGIGGIRAGLESAIHECGFVSECVFTSEIKPHAISILKQNHPNEKIIGDITKVDAKDIPDFDILCAGFPCQAFSAAGKREGFADTRGTLFFDVERILKTKKPKGFILENVEGLVNHDKGRTLQVILSHLEDIGYKVSYKVINSKNFGVPQERKRIYITGTFSKKISLDDFPLERKKLSDILEKGKPTEDSKFIRLLLSKFRIDELYGKSIKDKRGGKSNIHSWDLEIKGKTTKEERKLLDKILTERRKKKWAEIYNIDWMDGMPLTEEMIASFYPRKKLTSLLNGLVKKGYIVYEHPKKKIVENGVSYREYDTSLPKGYNIVAGKLSFEINKILDPNDIAPTLVAMDMQKLYVVDGGGLRKFTLREGLRLFGYPENFKFDINEKNGFDLLGNTVVVPVIKAVCKRLISSIR